MKTSVRWLNEYLDPGRGGPVSAEEAERVLTFAGFPIESSEKTATGDTCLDVEVTSNRGDVLSHVGVAREIAASTGRKLRLPSPERVFDWDAGGGVAGSTARARGGLGNTGAMGGPEAPAVCAVDNRVAESCPMFTARVISGLKVGPSPKWLVDALCAVGQRSINNVVDITNFVAFEYGQPSHVFDLKTIHAATDGKARVVVRVARKGETLKLLDGKTITLAGDELIVADEKGAGGRPISLAGVMGGFDTQVTSATTEVLLEAATWDPVLVRKAARRFALRTDASYRFERVVDPRTIEPAARRAAALIERLAGGRLLPGAIHAGPEPSTLRTISLRPSRCRVLLGIDVGVPRMQQVLEAHEVVVTPQGPRAGSADEPVLHCTIPAHRPDLEREIDLIEEVARTHGLDQLPVHEKVAVPIGPPQPSEQAARMIGAVLGGLGFFEAITYTFVSPAMAGPFLPAGTQTLRVSDERRAADPILRPSALPSLLACRRKNQDAGGGEGAEGGAGVRLYEVASAFAQTQAPGVTGQSKAGQAMERVNLAMIADACFPAGAKAIEQKQAAIRLMRGTIEALVSSLGGAGARVEIVPVIETPVPAFDTAAAAEVKINGTRAGLLGLISAKVQGEFGLDRPVVAAELSLDALLALYPPRSTAQALPQFPSIERDLSLIVGETVAWSAIDALVTDLRVPLLEGWSFVGSYRGQQTGAGRKSVTFRMRFRDPARTLTHDEVSPQVESIVAAAKSRLGAQVRTG